ncbi:MAG: PAS domain S-box protein [Pirellulales bacterium]
MTSPTAAVASPSLPLPSHVLVIEDDADACANLRDILELDEFQVSTAGSIAEALDRMSHDPVEMIILDRRLPDGSAEEAMPRLKAKAPDAAIIIITGYADLDGVITALREGADDYLLKPVNPDLLRNTLERIRERQHLAEEKRRSENAFRALVEAAGCMIVIVRPDGAIAYFNSFSEELTGYRAADVLGRDFFERFSPAADRSRIQRVFSCVLEGGVLRNYQTPLLRRDGSQALLLWNARRLDDYSAEPVLLAVGQDITTLKEAQDRALHAERLAAIGQMVAGLAHESRNALQRSQACLEMLELEIGDNPSARDLLGRIQRAQDQLHKLFDEVRGYVAPIQLDRSECQLSEAWREAWELLFNQRRGRDAQLRELPHTVDLHCDIDRFRIVQVFRNLLENSLAACHDPALIEIACSKSQLHGREALRISVRDNGPGLTAEQRARLFEPFYTTKTQGTGLGMPIAMRIVAAHEGDLVVGDHGPPGAELIVTLPRHKP